MLQAVPPPIIRSTKLYVQRQVLSNQYCLDNNSAISLNYNQQDAKFSRSIYFSKLLYMLQAVPPPIIRSTKLYIQRQVLSNQYCLDNNSAISLKYNQQDATFSRSFYFYKLLCMFQAVPPPIISSTKLYIEHCQTNTAWTVILLYL